MSDIGKRLRAARKEKRLTLTELARRIGCSHGYLSQIENGKSEPSKKFLVAIAAKMSLNEKWLLTGEGPMFIHQVQIEDRLDIQDDLQIEIQAAPGFEIRQIAVPEKAGTVLSRIGALAREHLADQDLVELLEFLAAWWPKATDEDRAYLRGLLRRLVPEFEEWLKRGRKNE